MDLSDDIAYSVHDFEDAIVNGYLDPARLSATAEHAALLSAIQSWVGFDFARDELEDALYRLMRLPEWITSFDGTRASHARLKNLTSDLIGRFARAATTATREAYATPMLTRYRAHVVVPRVVEAEMAVLKGIIGAVVVSIEGRKSVYKEQRRVLKRLATALWEQPDELDAVHARGFRDRRDGCRAPARHRRPGREPHRPARDRVARPPRRRGGCRVPRRLGARCIAAGRRIEVAR